MRTADAQLVVVAPDGLIDGFKLTGVATVPAETTEDAERVVLRLLRDGERGVIAIHGPLFAGLADDLQRKLRASVSPVVVELPTGEDAGGDAARKSRLARRLQHAIGYHVTFGEDSE